MELSEANFDSEVLKSSKPVIVDFWAPWCGPCKMIAPAFEKLSLEMKNIKFAKVNVDDNQNIAQQAGILGIPCLIIYNNGEEVDRIVGLQTEDQLRNKLTKVLTLC